MGYWIKRFFGQEYIGTDEAVKKGQASWRLSRQNGMIGVELGHGNKILRIDGLGEYWQSDVYSSQVGRSDASLIARRIMRKVKENDCFYKTIDTEDFRLVKFLSVSEEGARPIPKEWKKKWYVLEYKIGGDITFYISGDKV